MAIKEATPLGIDPATDAAKGTQKEMSQVIVQDSAKPNGLCIDCEDRGDCSLTAAEGGIWHCEEYR